MKAILLTAFIISSSLCGWAQSDETTLLTINGKEISVGEFLSIYEKNNEKNANPTPVEEYLGLFINYKLKVAEALDKGLDQQESFQSELQTYRKQLAKPYLIDTDEKERLLREAYERMKYDVQASYLLVAIEPNATPADTMKAWNKVNSIRSRIRSGEDFNKVAQKTSDDPMAKSTGGALKYQTVFMINSYRLESAMYNTPVGQLSHPIRTQHGYYLIKVDDKRPARGLVKVAHIMFMPKGNSESDWEQAKLKADNVYKKLQAGGDFTELAKHYSEDKEYGPKGGELPWFGINRMIPGFEEAAFSIEKKGSYTQPVKTNFGYHIIKLIDVDKPGTYEQEKHQLEKRLMNSPRIERARNKYVDKLKAEYSYELNENALSEFHTAVNQEVFNGTWKASSAMDSLEGNSTLITINERTYSQEDFARYIQQNQYKRRPTDLSTYLSDMFDNFVRDMMLEYEEERLAEKYPKFHYLMTEYHDGILLFDLSDSKIWSKAYRDTAGLRAYYQTQKQEHMWPERFDGTIYYCTNEEVKTQLQDYLENKENASPGDIDEKFNTQEQNLVVQEKGLWAEGDNEIIDHFVWNEYSYQEIKPEGNEVFVTGQMREPEPKSLNEVRGIITAAYQEQLEAEWIEQLHKTYDVKINQEALDKLKKRY